MTKPGTVTIALPVYRRMDTLPRALASVRAQSYAHIDLLVSDNGHNADVVADIVAKHYDRPFRLVQRAETLPIMDHFNALIAEAEGEYFVLLCDDDEITPDFAEELVGLLERHPTAMVAFPRNHVYELLPPEKGGTAYWPDRLERPGELLAGNAFLWHLARKDYGFGRCSTITNLARTAALREVRGYPEFVRGIHSDEAVLVKLALLGDVALAESGAFIWYNDPDSFGHSLPPAELALACHQYQQFLLHDAEVNRITEREPVAWAATRAELMEAAPNYYFWTWMTVFYDRMPPWQWVRAAIVPFQVTPRLYARVGKWLARAAVYAIRVRARALRRVAR